MSLDGNTPVLGDKDPKGPPDNRPPTKPPTEPKYPPPTKPPTKSLPPAVAFLAALLLLSACVPPSGQVVSRQERFSNGDGPSYLLCTQQKSGPVKCGEVDLKVWRACKNGDYYDQDLCDSRGKR